MKGLLLLATLLVPASLQAQAGVTMCRRDSEHVISMIDTDLLKVSKDGNTIRIAPMPEFAEVYFHELKHQEQIDDLGCEAAATLSAYQWAMLEVEAYCVSLSYALKRGADRDFQIDLYSTWVYMQTGISYEIVKRQLNMQCRS